MDNVIHLSNNQGQEESGWKSSKLYATELISEGVLLCSAKKLLVSMFLAVILFGTIK